MNPLRGWQTELPKMLARQEPESEHLDYKAKEELLLQDRSGKPISREKRSEGISRDVSSFMNSDGGTIIYGIREDKSAKGSVPVSEFDPSQDGYDSGEMTKDDLENLITSNIQYGPGPELFNITEVKVGERRVFVVDIAKNTQGVFQAKDKRYYKRFNFKAEPMYHYEIEDVRNRSISPELRLVFGLSRTWEIQVHRELDLANQEEQVPIHVGIRNLSEAVAEVALIELGVSPFHRLKRAPDNFKFAEERVVKMTGVEADACWYKCAWTPQNFGERYQPLFLAADPEYVTNLDFRIPQAEYSSRGSISTVGRLYWRLQAPGMTPRQGIVRLTYNHFGTVSVERDEHDLEIMGLVK